MSDADPTVMGEEGMGEQRGIARATGFEILDELSGEALLDNDGEVISELGIDAIDSVAARSTTVAELALEQRSWRYGHVIVDEAQDLTPMQWRMVRRRVIGRSMTIVGDLAQRDAGPAASWSAVLPPELDGFAQAELTINYRSPAEVNRLGTSVLAELAPELSAAEAIRESGWEPTAEFGEDLPRLVAESVVRLAADGSGRVAVIGATPYEREEADVLLDEAITAHTPAHVHLTPWQAKGLEFDAVVVVEPQRMVDECGGLSSLYVALTRSTHRLVIAHSRPLPGALGRAIGQGDPG